METEVQPAPEAGAGNDDVRAAVVAAFEQHSAPQAPEQAAAASEVDAPPSERARNERGQFIKADGSVDTEAEALRVPDADPATDKPDVPSTAIEPPKSWSADVKAEWSKLSPAVQQAVLKRETEINEGGRRWSEEKRAYDEMLSPVRAQAQRAGVDEREGLNRLLAANDYLERDPANALRWLAQAYGVDLNKPQDPSQARPPADPRVTQLHQEVSTLRQTPEQREAAEAASAINQFASSPGHEHFETVKVKMGQLMGTGQAKDLNDAYEQAIWATPEIRSQLIAAQTAQATEAKRAADRAAADKARRGAISLSGSPAGTPAVSAKPVYETVEDATRAAWAQHAG